MWPFSKILCLEYTFSGGRPLDKIENNSRTVKGAKVIGQEKETLTLILQPVKILSKDINNLSR